ncbi:ATP-binding protein [Brevundimonas sp.]|jgi:signal transduction histidine kinase|uniref:ATP-binding protein n=1 Tax=Brevundimonas sp. TaxID=1871086 RepID=UPI0037C098B6
MPKATVDTAASGWTVAVRHRRGTLLQRVGLGAAVALVVTPMMGWQVCLGWAVAYGLMQFLELVAFAPVTRGDAGEMPRWRKAIGCLTLFTSASLFGGLSIPMWLIGGPLGGVCAALMLPALMLFAMINSPRSKAILVSTLTPPMLYLLAVPFFAASFGAPSPLVMTASAAVVLYAIYTVISWQKMSEATENQLRAHAEADRLRLKAEQDLAAHTAFLAAVGHDLRTPIGAILTGAAELQALDSHSRTNAHLITDAGLMMKALLDDLLDHSKIGAGRMTVEAVDFDLRVMLAQTLRLWRGPVEAKGLKLRLEGAARMPRSVRGDPMRIRQVLNNLMSNAVKFTPQGEVTLRLDAWVEEPCGYSILFEVADTGPGMTADQLTRLFTPFDQTADGVSARHGGSGLGLAISRDLIELMGGRLTARSTPGQGARFTVSLFLPRGEEVVVTAAPTDDSRVDIARALASRKAEAAARPASAPTPQIDAPPIAGNDADPAPADSHGDGDEDEGRPLRLLVVDDHDINRRAVQLILQPLGCDIVTAADGMIALERCAETVFDVIFMDVRMPELDGRETTRRLRAGGGPNARTPVVAVTADTAPEDVAACQAAGMAYFVSKPLTPPALLGALQHVLDETAQASETEAA